MFPKLMLISVGLALVIAQASSQLPFKKNFMSDVQGIISAESSRVHPGPIKHTPAYELNEVDEEEYGRDDIKEILKLSDESRRAATVTIEWPVRLMKYLHLLEENIAWGMFKEMYKNKGLIQREQVDPQRKERTGY